MSLPITPANLGFHLENQEHFEQKAVLSDLERNPLLYLHHADAEVCRQARDTYDAFHLDRTVPAPVLPAWNAHFLLAQLYRRLRILAMREETTP